MTITNAQCKKYGDAIRQKVNEFYEPRIVAIRDMIKEELAAGRDPHGHPFEGLSRKSL